ncbi:MAG: patatin-like phospholipase family protein, partial [Thermoanaerobaculia bacterium]
MSCKQQVLGSNPGAGSKYPRRGSAVRAVRASVAIPGVLPPVPEGDELLVDGGVLNNLPIDAMREINPSGPVIAVDVLPPRGPRAKGDY